MEKGGSFSPETRYDLANCTATPSRILVKALHGIRSPVSHFVECFYCMSQRPGIMSELIVLCFDLFNHVNTFLDVLFSLQKSIIR